MPWGILLALGVVTILYIGVAVTVVSVVDYRELPADPAALSKVTDRAAPWLHPRTFDFITMFAVANTMLINYIMGSRLLYGMARQGLLPAVLGQLHAVRQTPFVAILTLLVVVFVLAVSAGSDAVRTLADATGLLLLTSFMVVNAALVVLKMRPEEPAGGFEVPILVPVMGIVVNAAMIFARVLDGTVNLRAPATAGMVVLGISVLYFIVRPQNVTEEALATLDAEG
jgi:amino acid transporter